MEHERTNTAVSLTNLTEVNGYLPFRLYQFPTLKFAKTIFVFLSNKDLVSQ